MSNRFICGRKSVIYKRIWIFNINLSEQTLYKKKEQRQHMARITIEDCLEKVDNRFSLVHLAARRVRQLRAGAKVMSDRNNKDVVLSLREIAAGKITAENIDDFNPRHQDELLLTDNEDDDEGLL